MHLQIGYMLDGLVRSDVSLQSNCKKADPLYDGDLPEFLLLLLLAVFKMDSREQLLAVSLTITNVTWYSSKSIGCLPGMYLLHTERVERLIYTQVDTPGNEFGKGIIK